VQSLPANVNRSGSSEISACKGTPKTNVKTGSTHSNSVLKKRREKGRHSKHYRVNNSEKKKTML